MRGISAFLMATVAIIFGVVCVLTVLGIWNENDPSVAWMVKYYWSTVITSGLIAILAYLKFWRLLERR